MLGSTWAQTRLVDSTIAVRRIWREIAWVVAGEIVGAVGSLVAVRLLTSNLSPEEYGHLALGLTVATLIAQTLMGPLANAGERFFAMAVEQRRLPELLWAILRLVAMASVITLAIGAVVIGPLLASAHSDWAFLAAAGFAFALTSGWERIVDGLQNAARARAIVAWHQAIRQWLRPAMAAILVAVFARAGATALLGFAVASVGVLVSQIALAWDRFSHAAKPLDDAIARTEQARLVRYAAPFAAWGLFTWLQLSSDRWVLELVSTPQAVGRYTVLLQLGIYPLTLVGTLFSQLAGPIVFARVGDGTDAGRLDAGFKITLQLVAGFFALSVVAVVAAILLHGPVFDALVAPAYRDISGLLPLAIAAGAMFNIGQLVCLLPMAADDPGALLPPKVGTASLSVPVYLAGAAQAGIEGVLIANLLIALLYVAWTAAVGWRVMRRVRT